MEAPSEVLQMGVALAMDLYIFLPLNESIIGFRREGEILTAQDKLTLDKTPKGHVLVLRTQRNRSLLESKAQKIGTILKSVNSLESPELKDAAGAMLGTLAPVPGAEGGTAELGGDLLNNLTEQVESLLSSLRGSLSLAAYENILKSVSDQKDPLTTHNRQVSALATLMLMVSGRGSMEDLADLSTAGLLHDVALAQLPVAVLTKHLNGEEISNTSEKLVYFRHIDMLMALLKKSPLRLSPGTLRIIEFHHENWDGSGFRGISSSQIYFPARFLRIADEAVPRLNRSGSHQGLKEVLEGMASEKGKSGYSIYDPEILKALLSV